MKTCLIFFLLVFSTGAFAQNLASSDEHQIQNLIQNSFDALFSNYDSKQLPDFYTEDFLLFEQGEIWDMAFITKITWHGPKQTPTLQPEPIDLNLLRPKWMEIEVG